jgi:electron transport complex protein RnfA
MDTLVMLLTLAVATAVVNNFVFTYFLGICSYLGVSKRTDMALGMGMAVTFVMAIAGLLTWLLNNLILSEHGLLGYDLSFVKYIVFIFVIAGAVQLVEMYIRKFHPPLYKAFGIFLPLITTNCAILGACLLVDLQGDRFSFATQGMMGLAKAVVFNVSAGLGFTLAIVLMATIREELEFADIPKPLQGAGITLLIAAILAMAFQGFAGMAG